MFVGSFSRSLLSLLFLAMTVAILHAEEGMYPISEIHKLDLKIHGLELESDQIFNPDGISLVDGIVNVGGCSGSFVSAKGLILTNHHCAYRAIQSASSAEADYLRDGFRAASFKEETLAPGYTVRITEAYQDVSEQVLSAVATNMSMGDRTRAIEKRIKELEKKAEAEHPGMRAQVSEMFLGKSYVLFLYTSLRDVRLVYAPPSSIGEYGGDIDNWEWPRHTGDFSFLRAYVAADGSPADYSPENVPYQPRKVLEIDPAGVREGDFVFILGYPGRTVRHRPSWFVEYEQEVRLPLTVDLYQWQIAKIQELGKEDPDLALKYAPSVKSRANVEKRARGKLQGLQRVGIVAHKQMEETALREFISEFPEFQKQYGSLFSDLEDVYKTWRATAEVEFFLYELKGRTRPAASVPLWNAWMADEGAIERQKPDLERSGMFMERNFERTQQRINLAVKNYDQRVDRALLENVLQRLLDFERIKAVPSLKKIAIATDRPKALTEFLDQLYADRQPLDQDWISRMIQGQPLTEKRMPPFLAFVRELRPIFEQIEDMRKQREGAISRLEAMFVDVKQKALNKSFVPDANGTLRLTFGNIRGYSPSDAVYMNPFTTLSGVVEKHTGNSPFAAPDQLLALHKARDYGSFMHPDIKDVPVDMLYDTDTTSGNSGSAIFNSKGKIVGVNFDRAFGATINDYAWNSLYSRSIGVDIRYVLWVTQKIGGAGQLLEEMGIPVTVN